MKTPTILNALIGIIIIPILIVFFARTSGLAQCTALSGPSYSNSCSTDYFTSINATGTGVTSSISYAGASCLGTYFNYYSSQGASAPVGATVSMQVNRCFSTYTGYISIWIDWNNDNTYQTTEVVAGPYTYVAGVTTHTFTFVVPSTGLVTGTHLHMRVYLGEAGTAPCTATYGETADYFFQANCSSLPTITTSPSSGSICAGGAGLSITASGAGTGGTYSWAPSTGLSATTGATVTASPSTTTVYTITGTTSGGCANTTTASVTVNPAPANIGGTLSVCAGSSTTLTDATTGGTWSTTSSNISLGSTGIVTGVTAGTAVVTYTASGCYTTAVVTVNPLPASITGSLSFCSGLSGTVSTTTSGVNWTTSNPTIATIGSGTGVVTGVSAGVFIITCGISATGCYVTASATVNPLPASITGTMTVCPGSTTTLSDITTGGTWSTTSSNASVGSASGIVTGISGGTAVITYTNIYGCYTLATVTINPAPAAISGSLTVCIGSSTTLTDLSGSGTWSASNTNVTIGSTTGTVTGNALGTSTITYTNTSTGCHTTAVETINSVPSVISGPATLCVLAAVTLTDGTSGGTWTASNTNVSVGSSTGVVTGVNSGLSVVTYTTGAGCYVVYPMTVNPGPSNIVGANEICVGANTFLFDGTIGGTWSSSNGNATIGSSSPMVTGVSAGTVTISYTASVTGCFALFPMTIDPLPANITGTLNVCVGSSVTFSDITPGGSWSVSNGNASIGTASGVATGINQGTDLVIYTLASTGCSVSAILTINPLPSAISGASSICVSSTTTLTDASSGGTWSSSNAFATVGSSTGIVTGNTAGVSVITYTLPTGCYITTTITVNSVPISIAGLLHVCPGATITLSDATTGGTWSCSNANINIGSSTGVVTGVTTGTSVCTYMLGTGCYATTTVTVDAVPPNITGPVFVCAGSNITLSDATSGGIWTCSNANASIGSATGVVTGVTAGPDVVTYTLPTGCYTTYSITVNPLPSVISGTFNVCVATTTTLTDATAGGTWSVSNSHAAIGTGSGIVSGITAGTSTITYTLGTGCYVTAPFTVNPVPVNITGSLNVCVGSSVTLFDGTGGGTWSVSNANASIGSLSGSVTGVNGGTDVVTYMLGTGCYVTTTVTVNPLPTIVSGPPQVCVGSVAFYSGLPSGGIWSSSNTHATIGVLSGQLNGISAGVSVITYTLSTGCITTTPVTINPLPSLITGTLNVCAGSTVTLSDATTGGTWSSSNANVAIGSLSGIVTGINAGTSVISYTLGTGCFVTATVTINPLPAAISGATIVCVGSTSPLTDASGPGTWSISNTNASIGSLSGIVTGVTAGTSVVTYTLSTGCLTTIPITVNSLPAPITGGSVVCLGATLALNDPGGGLWTSSNAHASVGSSSGVVTGVSLGTSVITYALGSGCVVMDTVTVAPLPSAISGIDSVCEGSTVLHSCSPSGGTWSTASSNVSVGSASGIVTGVTAGLADITYTLGTGCFSTVTITVDPLPDPLPGTVVVCIGASATLTDLPAGGTWSVSNTNATIGSSTGVVSGVSAGASTITYMLGTGCFITKPVTVNPLPGPVTGSTVVCAGSTTSLTDAGGGTWTSSNTTIAMVGSSSGIVSGINAGPVTITYTLPTGCYTVFNMTVNPLPAVIGGSPSLCLGSTAALTDAGGGFWTSSNTSIATIGSVSGLVTGTGFGLATITYTLLTGCSRTVQVTVNPLPGSISGAPTVCAGSTITLTDGTPGGSWSSSDITRAGVGSSTGVVTGVAGGTAVVSYTLATGCYVTKTITINPLPTPISGSLSLCLGTSDTLSSLPFGGTWSSSSAHIAIGSSNGVASAVSTGSSVITYILPTGCSITATMNVISLPSPISGPSSVCVGSAVTLTDPGGGIWTASNTNVLIGSTSGVVTGVATGTATVTYTVGSGCFVIKAITVNPYPSVITGPASVCLGTILTLTDSVAGGTWTSSNTSIITINSGTGQINALNTGTSVISYTLGSGCARTLAITVNSIPAAIGGPSSVCQGLSATLTDPGGGIWSSSNSSVAAIGSATGIIAGINVGTVTVTYTLGSGCTATKPFTVNAVPAMVVGPSAVCIGSSITLTDSTTGGFWSSTSPGTAGIGSASGIVTGNLAGTTTILYSLPTGCTSTKVVTVQPIPGAISGTLVFCQGASSVLSDGVPGGTWSSSDTTVATIGATTGVVHGIAAGHPVITYSLGTGCRATTVVTVNPDPAAISGSLGICIGSTVVLTDGTPGGTWTSSNATVAPIGSATGIVNGLAIGAATITYTAPNGCFITGNATVDPLPAAIAGFTSICVGASVFLTDAVSGGTWASGNVAIATIDATSGAVTGVASGTAPITYTLGSGCVTTGMITVSASPAPIAGPDHVCVGTAVTLSDTTTGGVWSTGSPTVATVGTSSGVVTGMSSGTAIISFTKLSTGCSAVKPVIVNPISPVLGPSSVCVGYNIILTDTTLFGSWSSGDTSIAAINTAGVVTGVSAGMVTISYSFLSGCLATKSITVNPIPPSISGSSQVCAGQSTTLTDATPGGTWASSLPAIGTINAATGHFTGLSAGVVTISYTILGCPRTFTITVNPLPAPVTGTLALCQGHTATISDTVAGGMWTSSNSSIATIGSVSGIINGVSAGSATMTYTLPTGCYTTAIATVYPTPAAIAGSANICVGSSVILADPSAGGTWTSSLPSVAGIDLATGLVTGYASGVATITYTVASGCYVTRTVTVNDLPPAPSGPAQLCAGSSATFTDGLSGGTWTSSNPTIATAGSFTGLVTGMVPGIDTITFTLVVTGCSNFTTVSVNPLPSPVTGPSSLCAGLTGAFSDMSPAGTWSSSDPSVAYIDSNSGVVSGISGGVVSITYTVPTGCIATKLLTVHPVPLPITGNHIVCLNSTSALHDSIPGATWYSGNPAIAVVDSVTGVVSGLSLGTDLIWYTFGVGCTATTTVTVVALPVAFNVTGGGSFCAGDPGADIGLSGSASGVNYFLYNGPVATGSFAGTGAPLDFGLQTVAGVYTVTAVSNVTGCRSSMHDSAVIAPIPTILPAVAIHATPGDTVCAGTTVTFTPLPVNGGTAPLYQWKVNGVNVAAGSSYAFLPANGDVVSVTLTSNAHCASPATATSSLPVVVNPYGTPGVHLDLSPGDTVCRGSLVTITAVPAFGGSSPAYTWLKNGVISGAGGSFSYVPANNDQVYAIIQSNYPCRLANVDTSPVTVITVDTPLVPQVTINANPGTLVSVGQMVSLTASVVNGGDAPTYQWLKNGVPLSGATNSIYSSDSFGHPVADSITCMVTSSGLCKATSFQWVYINVAPVGVGGVRLISDLAIIPNPSNGDFLVKGALGVVTDEQINLEITDMLGRVVYSDRFLTKGGSISHELKAGRSLSSGQYLLNLIIKDEKKVFRIVIDRSE